MLRTFWKAVCMSASPFLPVPFLPFQYFCVTLSVCVMKFGELERKPQFCNPVYRSGVRARAPA